MWKGPAYDCQQCGACCSNHEFIPATGYVSLTNQEAKRMKRLGLSVIQAKDCSLLGTRTQVGSTHTICVALRGQIGSRCSCAVYEHRPGNCRRFEVGSLLCKVARADAGLPE
jgi:Fe-S-cluster containining protein